MAETVLPAPVSEPTYSILNASKDNVSVSASTYLNDTSTIQDVTGYTPIGIVSFSIGNASSNGARSAYVECSSYELANSTTVNYRLYNRSTSAAKVHVYIQVLCRKNS